MAPRRQKNNLAQERAQVQRKIRNARSKARRLERNGITDLGKHDPFRTTDIGRYNRAQLAAYSRQLDQFTSRKTQLVPNAHGEAMTRENFEKYVRPARERREQARQFFAQIENLPAQADSQGNPDRAGFTIGDQDRRFTPDRGELHNPAANPIHRLDVKESDRFDSEKGLKKAAESVKKQAERGYLKNVRRDTQKLIDDSSLDNMRDSSGNLIRDRLNNLTDQQWGYIWMNRSFSDAMSGYYQSLKDLQSGPQQSMSEEAVRAISADYANDVERIINLTERVMPHGGMVGPQPKPKRRRR